MNDYLVAILNAQTLQSIFSTEGANPMNVTVRETSKLTSWPVEDGTQRTDHRVLDPIEIEISLLLSSDFNRDLFDQLRQIYLRGDDIFVQTKMRTYEAMMLTEIPHEEQADQWGNIPVTVRLKEVITIKPEFGTLPPSKVANPKQSSTTKKGGQQTAEADAPTRRKASVLYRVAN